MFLNLSSSSFLFFLVTMFLLPNRSRAALDNTSFIFHGFDADDLDVDGAATVRRGGVLELTNYSIRCIGLALRSTPVHFRSKPRRQLRRGDLVSFSTTFVVAMIPKFDSTVSFGMAFVVSPSSHLQPGPQIPFFGIFNSTNNGSDSNHVFAIVLNEIKNNVGVLVNGAGPILSRKAAYYEDGGFKNVSFIDEHLLQVWVDYDFRDMELSVMIAPFGKANLVDNRPFLSTKINLSQVILDTMYLGFSATSGNAPTSHSVLGWSFRVNGRATSLDPSRLPVKHLPQTTTTHNTFFLATLIPLLSVVVLILAIAGIVLVVRRKIKFAELLEDWEQEYGPHRFSYKDLFTATNGFKDKELLGVGGFGKVYRGVLLNSKREVAVKKISHDSKQGMREFVAEIVSIGRLRHRNLVQLLGYCRRKGELLLVYEFMPNGSLDKYLFDVKPKTVLDWSQRLHIVRGVASGLLYLHQGWEQLVIHRDVKASNVLLDGDLNGRLGDFGLARLYDHGTNPQTTHVVGTMGYMAPELTRTGKYTKATDVFSFGVFLLEIACGRRPIEPHNPTGDVIAMDWVLKNWRGGRLLSSMDPNLGGIFVAEEAELVLKLGLLCSHVMENARPSMRHVVQFLDGESPLPKLSMDYWKDSVSSMKKNESFDEYVRSSSSSSVATAATGSMFLSGGR